MKKFLTMLLALSVVFTYTFGAAGSVFAVEPTMDTPASSTDAQLYKAAVDYAINNVASKNYDKVVAEGLASSGLEISADAWAKVKADYMDAIETAIGFNAEGKVDHTYYQNFNDKLTAEALAYACFSATPWWTEEKQGNDNDMKEYILAATALVLDAAKAEAKIQLDDAYDILANKMDLAAYATEDQKAVKDEIARVEKELDKLVDGYDVEGTDNDVTSYKDLETVGEVKAMVDNLAVTDAATVVSTSVMKTIAKEYWSAAKGGFTAAGGESTTGKYLVVSTVAETIADVAAGVPEDTATKAGLKAKVSKSSADFITDVIDDNYIGDSPKFATLKKAQEYAAAYEEVMNALIENGDITAEDVITAYTDVEGSAAHTLQYSADAKGWVDASDAVAELVAYAAKYKAQTDSEGNLVRDAAEIDKIVKAATKDLYRACVGIATVKYADLDAAKDAVLKTTVKNDAAEFTFAQKASIAAMELTADEKSADCYALEAKAVAAALETAKAAVNAATKDAEIATAEYNFERALKAIKNRTAVEALFGEAALAREITAQNTAVATYVTYVNSTKNAYDDTVVVYDTDFCKALLIDYYIEKDARTAAEVKAIALDAATVAGMLPTKASQTAAEKAYKDAVDALPSKITAADQALVEAAIAAKESAADNAVTNVTYAGKISTAIDSLEATMKNDLWNAYAAIDKTDKSALRAMQDKIDEFNRLYAEGKVLNENAGADFEIAAIASDLAKIKKTEKQAVIDAIDAFPLNISESNRAQIEAARALYDAYVADWTNVYDIVNGYVAGDITNYNALTNAETLLKDNTPVVEEPKYTDKDVKAAVYDMAKTTSYTKPSKTSVKLTAKADVTEVKENGYTVKYRFYQKGPKKTSYKLWKTSTSAAYTFKGLKKGTHNFKVKVSVYNAEGKLVAYKYTNVRTLKIK